MLIMHKKYKNDLLFRWEFHQKRDVSNYDTSPFIARLTNQVLGT